MADRSVGESMTTQKSNQLSETQKPQILRIWRVVNAVLLLLAFLLPIIDRFPGWVVAYWGLSLSAGILSPEWQALSAPLLLIDVSLLSLIIYALLNLRIAVTGVQTHQRKWLILSLGIAAFGFVFLGLWFASESTVHQGPLSIAWGYWVVIAGLLSSIVLELSKLSMRS
jgi:hypothetical protein